MADHPQDAGPGPDGPLGVVLVSLRSAEEGGQAGARDGGDGPAEALHLGDQPRQGVAHYLAQILRVQPAAFAHRTGELGEQHAHQPPLLLERVAGDGEAIAGTAGAGS